MSRIQIWRCVQESSSEHLLLTSKGHCLIWCRQTSLAASAVTPFLRQRFHSYDKINMSILIFLIGNRRNAYIPAQLLVQDTAAGEHYRSCIQNTWCLQISESWWPWQDCFRWTKWRQQQSNFPRASYQRKADLPIPTRWHTFDIYTSLWQECLNQNVNYRLLWIWFHILIIYIS